MPFWQSGNASSSTSSQNLQQQNQNHQQVEGSNPHTSNTVSTVARSILPTRRRLRLDPANKLYFPYEPGKQARSAIRIKNTSRSHVAFKAMEKLKRHLAEAEAALEARKKPPEDKSPRIVGEGLVIDEWKERRERYLARQQVEGVDSL